MAGKEGEKPFWRKSFNCVVHGTMRRKVYVITLQWTQQKLNFFPFKT